MQHWVHQRHIDPQRSRWEESQERLAIAAQKAATVRKVLAEAAAQGSWTSILLIYAMGVLGAATISQVVPIVGDIVQVFHAASYAGWIVSSPSALVAVGALMTGSLVDRVGDKPILILGSVTVVAGDLGVAAAPSFAWLLGMRLVQGVGYVCISVAAIAMMTRITQGSRRNVALTLWSSYIPMSFAVPLLLVSQLAGTGEWRWAFYGHAITLGALLLFALVQLPGGQLAQQVGPALTGLKIVLRSPALYLLGLTFASASFVQTGVLSVLPQVLARNYGISIGVASLVGVVGMMFKASGCLAVGTLLNRGTGPIAIATAGVLLSIAGGSALGCLLPGYFTAALVACLFFFGAGLVVGLWALVPLAAPSRETVGVASGMVTQVTLWGVLFGPPAAFAAIAPGNWLWEGVNITLGGLTILMSIVLVTRLVGRTVMAEGFSGAQVRSAH